MLDLMGVQYSATRKKHFQTRHWHVAETTAPEADVITFAIDWRLCNEGAKMSSMMIMMIQELKVLLSRMGTIIAIIPGQVYVKNAPVDNMK